MNRINELRYLVRKLEAERENYYKASEAVGGFFDEIAELTLKIKKARRSLHLLTTDTKEQNEVYRYKMKEPQDPNQAKYNAIAKRVDERVQRQKRKPEIAETLEERLERFKLRQAEVKKELEELVEANFDEATIYVMNRTYNEVTAEIMHLQDKIKLRKSDRLMEKNIERLSDQANQALQQLDYWIARGQPYEIQHCQVLVDVLDSLVLICKHDLYDIPDTGWPDRVLEDRIKAWEVQLDLLHQVRIGTKNRYALQESIRLMNMLNSLEKFTKHQLDQRKGSHPNDDER